MHAFTHTGGQQRVEFIGRTETLNADLRCVSDRLDLGVTEIENKNVSTPPTENLKYLHHYDAESPRIVNTLYAEDFARFGYAPVTEIAVSSPSQP